jgi:NADH-quinone oxidoreductase subunit F
MSKNISKLSGRKGLQENLFDKVRQTGSDAGDVASQHLLGKSSIHGSRGFYDFLSENFRQQKAWVCNGTSCLCSGDQESLKVDLEKALGEGKVGTMTCLGRCYHGDSFQFDGANYSGGQSANIKQLTKEKAGIPGYGVSCDSKIAVLTNEGFATLNQFTVALENLLEQSRMEILALVKASGLRGRGGAGFSAGIKWESCMREEADSKFVVCNADEGDPGAFSDRYLLEQQPLRVIFGMLVAGWITGAKEGVVYIRGEYPESISIMREIISQLYEKGLLGSDILGKDLDFDLYVLEGAGAYICGEETSLLASIEGRRPEVDVRPPFPAVEGLYKQPTVVNNVETLASVQGVLDMGADAYASLGSGRSTGTKLVSLDAGFCRPGIVEVEMGVSLRHVINDVAGGFRVPTKAIHIGGPLGGLVPVDSIDALNVDYESFATEGFLLGHASFVCIPESFPMVRYLQHLFEFVRDESCGKCFPCRLGSVRGEEMFSQAIVGEKRLNRDLVNDLLDTMEQGSLCALGGGLPLPVRNILQYFADELQEYFHQDMLIHARQLS